MQHTETLQKRSISIREFAQRHSMNPATVRRRIASGELEAFRSGKLIRILVEEEERWIGDQLRDSRLRTHEP